MAKSRSLLGRFFRLLHAAGMVVFVGFLFCSGFLFALFVSLMLGAGVWSFVWGVAGGIGLALSLFVFDDHHWFDFFDDGGGHPGGDDGGSVLDVFDD